MRRLAQLLVAACFSADFVLAEEPEEVPRGIGSPAPVVEGPRALSLAEFEQLALQNNPTLAQAAAQVQTEQIQPGQRPQVIFAHFVETRKEAMEVYVCHRPGPVHPPGYDIFIPIGNVSFDHGAGLPVTGTG